LHLRDQVVGDRVGVVELPVEVAGEQSARSRNSPIITTVPMTIAATMNPPHTASQGTEPRRIGVAM
jgi:hypothetical protein